MKSFFWDACFLILDAYRPYILIYVSKDMRIRGYFSMQKGVREQNIFGNTGLIKRLKQAGDASLFNNFFFIYLLLLYHQSYYRL